MWLILLLEKEAVLQEHPALFPESHTYPDNVHLCIVYTWTDSLALAFSDGKANRQIVYRRHDPQIQLAVFK